MNFHKESRKLPESKRKYAKGSAFNSIAEFQAAIDKHQWVWMWGKALHPTVASSQQHRVIAQMIAARRIFSTIRNPASPYIYEAFSTEHQPSSFGTRISMSIMSWVTDFFMLGR